MYTCNPTNYRQYIVKNLDITQKIETATTELCGGNRCDSFTPEGRDPQRQMLVYGGPTASFLYCTLDRTPKYATEMSLIQSKKYFKD